ncbi:imidazoleglycerol-phosphate dehydratase HisB [Candidatus Vidania fulgoroideorum]
MKIYYKRITSETKIFCKIYFCNKKSKIKTGISFLNHMLEQMCFHGNFNMTLYCFSDLSIDIHHVVEDIGIVFGKIFKKLKKKKKYKRYSYCSIPMDESITKISLDVSGRSYYNIIFKNITYFFFGFDYLKEFIVSFVNNAKVTMHIKNKGKNMHHRIESFFKAFGIIIKKTFLLKNNLKKHSTK